MMDHCCAPPPKWTRPWVFVFLCCFSGIALAGRAPVKTADSVYAYIEGAATGAGGKENVQQAALENAKNSFLRAIGVPPELNAADLDPAYTQGIEIAGPESVWAEQKGGMWQVALQACWSLRDREKQAQALARFLEERHACMARFQEGRVQAKQKAYDAAIAAYSAVLETCDRYPKLGFTRAEVYYRLGYAAGQRRPTLILAIRSMRQVLVLAQPGETVPGMSEPLIAAAGKELQQYLARLEPHQRLFLIHWEALPIEVLVLMRDSASDAYACTPEAASEIERLVRDIGGDIRVLEKGETFSERPGIIRVTLNITLDSTHAALQAEAQVSGQPRPFAFAAVKTELDEQAQNWLTLRMIDQFYEKHPGLQIKKEMK